MKKIGIIFVLVILLMGVFSSASAEEETLFKEHLIVVAVQAYFWGAQGFDCERMALDFWYFSNKRKCKENPAFCTFLIEFSRRNCEIGKLDAILGKFTLPQIIHLILQQY